MQSAIRVCIVSVSIFLLVYLFITCHMHVLVIHYGIL